MTGTNGVIRVGTVIIPRKKFAAERAKHPGKVFELVREAVMIGDRELPVALRIAGNYCELTLGERTYASHQMTILHEGTMRIANLYDLASGEVVGSIEITGFRNDEECKVLTALRALDQNQDFYSIEVKPARGENGKIAALLTSEGMTIFPTPKGPMGIGTPVIPTEALLEGLDVQMTEGVFHERGPEPPRTKNGTAPPGFLRPVPDPEKKDS